MLHGQAVAEVTASGQPFEVALEPVLDATLPVFVHRKRSLRELMVDACDRQAELGYFTLEGETLTRGELPARVAAVAAVLHDRYGVAKGDRVGILAANCIEYAVAFWAVTSIGGIVCAFNGWWTTDEIRYAAELTEPKVLIGDAKRLERVAGIELDCAVIEIERDWRNLEALAAPLPTIPIDEDDPALILFTSGTTGRSKGALISHRGLVGFVQVIVANAAVRSRLAQLQAAALDQPFAQPPPPNEQTVTLLTSPMFHVSGLLAGVIMGLPMGPRMVLRRGRFDPLDVLGLIERERITTWSPIGGTGPRVIHHPRFGEFDVSSIKQVSFGGGPTSPAVRAELQAAFPNVGLNMGNGYGSSETVASVSSNSGFEYEREPLSAGRATPTCRIEIWDEHDRPVADGIEGRVVVQSAYNMLGYWRNDAATAETIRRERFLDTGDIGSIKDGLLFINSRARDMIIRSGENIYPIEVESRIEAHPSVRECAVVASDHPEHGQEVKAIVVPAPGVECDFVALAAFAAETLAAYKVPSLWELRGDSLPRNASGKVLKTVLLGEASEAPHDHREH